MDPITAICTLADQQIGYREKRSNKDLDSMTGNAGSANYTKYARDMDALKTYYNGRKQGVAYCDVFYDWLFVQLFGPDVGRRMIHQPLRSSGAGCRYSRDYYIRAGQLYQVPQIGDQVFFWPKIRINLKTVQHTGLVRDFDGHTLITVEGNVSDGVGRRSYKLNDARLAGFGRPSWALVGATVPTIPEQPATAVLPMLQYGDVGADVKRMQQLLEAAGFKLKRYGADGKFGSETRAAVQSFQQRYSIPYTGIVNAATWQRLLKV